MPVPEVALCPDAMFRGLLFSSEFQTGFVHINICKSDIILYHFSNCTDKIYVPGKSILHCPVIQKASFHSTIMGGAYRKRRFNYREARGAAAWRPAVMRNVPLSGRPRDDPAWAGSSESGLCPKYC